MISASESETYAIAGELARRVRPGDTILLAGVLGAGKTTFVRGFVEALGWRGAVRSPTFNLIQTFDTKPPVMHADLYRLKSATGLGIEDYLDDHVCLIEWPDRLAGLVDPTRCFRVSMEFHNSGRMINITEPD